MIPLLAESEKGTGQAESLDGNIFGDVVWWSSYLMSQSELESSTLEGDSPVDEMRRTIHKKSRASWIRGLNIAGLTANPK